MADDAFFSLLTETKINLGVCISHSWFDFELCMLKLVEGDPMDPSSSKEDDFLRRSQLFPCKPLLK